MRLPLSLIRSFVSLDASLTQIAEVLTLLGLEVDSVSPEHPPFKKVVVGEILSAKPHPNADKLQIAEVQEGKKVVQVVCAAANCRSGLKSAFAPIGASVGDRTIEKGVIRGVESHGMLCSFQDLGLPESGEGIIELPDNMEAGQDLGPILWDPIFEISLTPNLGHCMSALGVARELSAALKKPIHHTAITFPENKKNSPFTVSIPDRAVSPRYMCRLIEGVKIGPSPFWLQQQLLASGMKPISNAVDIANYIMIKRGQPLHVFDADKLEGNKLSVAKSEKTQQFLGLDQIEREVPAGVLFISDAKKPVAIAGVLGGENSSVSESTKNILIEAAVFESALVRKGAKHALRTESSQRFEKGVDPVGTESALQEACSLLLKLCGGQIASETIDIQNISLAPKQVNIRAAFTNKLLGAHLSFTEIEDIFHRLGFKTHPLPEETIRVDVPLYRHDITEEIDLIEEVARIYGYNNIPKGPSLCRTSQIPHDPAYLFEKHVRSRLSALGLQEFLNSDLISPKLASLAQEIVHSDVSLLKALHAKTEEYSILRPSLLPGLMQSAKANFDFKNFNLRAFEIGRIHFLQKGQLVELPMGAILLSGLATPMHWSSKGESADFFDLKGMLQNLLVGLKVQPFAFHPSAHATFHPGRQSDIQSDGLTIGSFGEIHPALLAKFGLKQRLLFAEFNLTHLHSRLKTHRKMEPIPQFPSSERDWTIPLPLRLEIETIFRKAQEERSPLLEKIELIDLYIPPTNDVKNATFRFTYRDKAKTISFEEVETEHARLVKLLANCGS
jgi:phenylalanyl-tRNA synthetase beta chain